MCDPAPALWVGWCFDGAAPCFGVIAAFGLLDVSLGAAFVSVLSLCSESGVRSVSCVRGGAFLLVNAFVVSFVALLATLGVKPAVPSG